jgi:hypothetical protein
MSLIASNSTLARVGTLALAVGLLAAAPGEAGAARQAAEAGADPVVVSSQVFLSGDVAALSLELRDGRTVELSLAGGRIQVDGTRVGQYRAGGALDSSFRSLLGRIQDAGPEEVARQLLAWRPPEGPGANRMRARLAEAITAADPALAAAAAALREDTVRRLQDRIRELEREVRRGEQREPRTVRAERRARGPLHYIGRGITGILSVAGLYIVLAGLGFAAVFFGRRYVDGVSDTARYATLRSGLVGFAGTFLLLPLFVLGTIALAISIVGIPLLIVWVMVFPLALTAALALGYLGVAHAMGEAFAERRFYPGDTYRANSYFFILAGLALLLGLYVAGHVVGMAGPWLGFIRGALMFTATIVTWLAITIGFGAVLLSRGGTQPVRPSPEAEMADLFEEETRV